MRFSANCFEADGHDLLETSQNLMIPLRAELQGLLDISIISGV